MKWKGLIKILKIILLGPPRGDLPKFPPPRRGRRVIRIMEVY